MQLTGRLKELFDAFTQINELALKDERLISSHVLSKAPNYNDILKKFLLKEPIAKTNSKNWRFYTTYLTLFLKYLINNFGHLFYIITAIFCIKLSGFKVVNLKKLTQEDKPLLFIDTFLLVPKIIQDKCFKEAYLPNLQDDKLQRIYIFRLYGSRNPFKVCRAFKILAKQKNYEAQPFLALTDLNLLTLSDIFSLVKHIVCFPFSLFRLISRVQKSEFYSENINSAFPYILDSLKNSLAHCNLIPEARRLFGLRLGFLLQDAKPRILTDSKLVSWHEKQSINKAFYSGLRQAYGLVPLKNNNTKTLKPNTQMLPIIGLQLFIFPHNLLNCYADALETRLGLAPDITLYSGKLFISLNENDNILGDDKNFIQELKLGASLRYAQLFERLKQDKFQQARKKLSTQPFKNCLVLLSYHPDETRRILNFVKEISLTNSEFSFNLRFHPATQIKDFQSLLPKNYQLATGNLYDNLETYSFVLGAGSGALTEAVALGVPALHIDDASESEDISLNYLGEFGKNKLWGRIKTTTDFLKITEQLFIESQKENYNLLVTEFREQFFTEPTPEAIKKMLA